MKVDVLSSTATLDRVPTAIDYSHEIQTYGEDNLYPQRMERTRNRSYTTKTATESAAGFLYGSGFVDQLLATTRLNRFGMTGNALLKMTANDVSIHQGLALHVNYNLNYRVREVNYTKFKFVRMGLPGKHQIVQEYSVCNNWENNPYKNGNSNRQDIYVYPGFNPNRDVVSDQVKNYGGIKNYPGQLLYLTPEPYVYPECTFDAVVDYAQVQRELGVFDISKIQNGLTATLVFKYPGTFEDEDQKDQFSRKLNKHKGAAGANTTIVVENPTGGPLNLTETIQLQNLDKLHTELVTTAKDSIRESYRQPMEIHGAAPKSGMFNKQAIQEAYTYYNTITQDLRDYMVYGAFQRIMPHWHQQNVFTTYDIKQKVYAA